MPGLALERPSDSRPEENVLGAVELGSALGAAGGETLCGGMIAASTVLRAWVPSRLGDSWPSVRYTNKLSNKVAEPSTQYPLMV
jgi:hypothetical protein